MVDNLRHVFENRSGPLTVEDIIGLPQLLRELGIEVGEDAETSRDAALVPRANAKRRHSGTRVDQGEQELADGCFDPVQAPRDTGQKNSE